MGGSAGNAPAPFNTGAPKAEDVSKKSAGAPQDYTGAAQQQAQSSHANVAEQTQANRPNVNTPFSSQQWSQGADGTWQLNQGFNGGLGQGASSLEQQFGQANANPMDPSLFGAIPNGDAARNQAIDASYSQATSRLNPQWDQRGNQLDAKLAAQGLDPTSEAARNAQGSFGRDRNDAYGSAMNSAIGMGNEAGQQVFGQNQAAHQQALSDALSQRNAPLQGLQGLSQLTGGPQFNQAGLSDPTQYLQAAQGIQSANAANAQLQNSLWTSGIGAVGQVAGAAASFSDARVKHNIRRLSIEAMPGVPFATWDWNPGYEAAGAQVGVIAQDLQKVAPEYVSADADGLLHVDYSFLSEGK